jgi:hypothetical protein
MIQWQANKFFIASDYEVLVVDGTGRVGPHRFAGLRVRDQQRLVKYWQESKETFEEGPYGRPEARC